MKADLKFDLREIKRAIKQLAPQVNKSRRELTEQAARGFVKEVVAITPPAGKGRKGSDAKKAGEAATVASMKDPAYLQRLADGNIGVLLGSSSAGLCSIDFDADAAGEEFLNLNPLLRGMLRTRGSRGFNCWVRIVGDFPASGKMRDEDGEPLGEWRANGNQTVIHGVHPSGCLYQRLNEMPPIEMNFEAIVWPDGWRLPWSRPQTAVSAPLPTAPASCETGSQMIVLPGNKVSFTECADQIFRRIAPSHTLFSRGGAIMELETVDDVERVRLAVIRPAAFRSRIESFGELFVWRTGQHGVEVLKPTTCPEETACGLMETKEARELLPRISSVVNCPLVVETADGLNVLGPGYHTENGGILVVGGEHPPEVPVCEAANSLGALLDEFDFQTPGDRSRALASLITPALKLGGFLRDFAPADVAEADQSQSGKTYRQRVAAAIYNETPKLIAARNGGVGSVDESFAQALIGGKPFIQLDNFRGKMDSQYIEAFLTAVGGSARASLTGERFRLVPHDSSF